MNFSDHTLRSGERNGRSGRSGRQQPVFSRAGIAHIGGMNDAAAPVGHKPAIVRPRDAASLILLRGAGRDLELLAGRRPGHVKFMPGVWVFPGGAIDHEDNKPWRVESSGAHLPPRLLRCARAALRETWEEVGVLVGRPSTARPMAASVSTAPHAALAPVEAAYAEQGILASIDALTYVGRAIT